MPDATAPANPIAALLALEVPDDYRELAAIFRERAELALEETRRGMKSGPAMTRHITDGLGHPEMAIGILDMLDQLVAAIPARKEEAKAIQQFAENAPKIAKFIESVKAFINERPTVIESIHDCASSNARDYWRWNGHAEARRQLADALNLTVPHEIGETTASKTAQAEVQA